MPSGTEDEKRVDLKGTPANPGRDPKTLTAQDKKQVGYIAINDGLIIIGVMWAIVFAIVFSLRHFNV